MIACVDVAYQNATAVAAAAVIRDWADATPIDSAIVRIADVRHYRPGFFYERELPCLLAVLARLSSSPSQIVIDGYVWLGADRPGLGAYLYGSLPRKAAIIGVAKSRFAGNTAATELWRGQSRRPLFITACGIDLDTAVECIRAMHGPFRIPAIISRVDSLARATAATWPAAAPV